MGRRQMVGIGMLAVVLAVPAAAPGQPPKEDHLQRRYEIKIMEGVLVGAARHGAELLARRLEPINPNLVLLTGTARARGFLLEGYGLFFDVEIPALRGSVAWTIRTMERDAGLARAFRELRQVITGVPDARLRAEVERALRRVELELGPVAPVPGERPVTAAAAEPTRPEGERLAPTPDPDDLYTESVKNALIDAMIEYSGPVRIGPDEWLTVAARGADAPFGPSDEYEMVTLVLRIKGSDLAAYRAGRLTREAVRARVEVREF
ncbi:MAG TPA: hypothetical protein VNI83_10630 [Vicinamibacterales bacterium]|nr:hypothetical protein [Vicinamibacterales bacterium]